MNNYKGTIIKESLESTEVLNTIKIISTEIEKVTPDHNTPWLSKWTMVNVEIPLENAKNIADELSKSIDKNHSNSWYVEFNNHEKQFVIFRDKVFCFDLENDILKQEAKEYGKLIGILERQLDF